MSWPSSLPSRQWPAEAVVPGGQGGEQRLQQGRWLLILVKQDVAKEVEHGKLEQPVSQQEQQVESATRPATGVVERVDRLEPVVGGPG